MSTTRRDFLKVAAGAVAVTPGVWTNSKQIAPSTASTEQSAAPAVDAGKMIYRRFGSTDVHISAMEAGR